MTRFLIAVPTLTDGGGDCRENIFEWKIRNPNILPIIILKKHIIVVFCHSFAKLRINTRFYYKRILCICLVKTQYKHHKTSQSYLLLNLS